MREIMLTEAPVKSKQKSKLKFLKNAISNKELEIQQNDTDLQLNEAKKIKACHELPI